ncbi:PIN domain-containing protein [Pseudomonas oryziphila]|uniref:PIN domain-containing protein n=1 Tax=Pseudomonas oryziphila TaxID=2894079 RepID=A0ABM7CPG3_9PSED|nr:hypothetical protein [Pseudomonas oryziphila]AZL73279.1 hypothetical protein EI693_09310 [Pseudomonas oryziphila]
MARKLIIDTNLLLLLVIGSLEGGRFIRVSKRLKKFADADYQKVLAIIAEHDEVHITPYIATEISNLIDLTGPAYHSALAVAGQLFSMFRQVESDIHTDSSGEHFLRFGITDNSLIQLASDYFILTDDHRMLGPLFASQPANIIPYTLA